MEIKNLNELAAEIHQNAVAHGWWEEDRGVPEVLMLCVSELAEALEEYREDRPMVWHACSTPGTGVANAQERTRTARVAVQSRRESPSKWRTASSESWTGAERKAWILTQLLTPSTSTTSPDRTATAGKSAERRKS